MMDNEDLQEMIANLGRGRLKAEATLEIENYPSRYNRYDTVPSSAITSASGVRLVSPTPKPKEITAYAQGYGGRQYVKKVMPHPDGTLPYSVLFNPDNPLSDGWQEWEKAGRDEENDEEVRELVNEELHEMRRDGKAEKGE